MKTLKNIFNRLQEAALKTSELKKIRGGSGRPTMIDDDVLIPD